MREGVNGAFKVVAKVNATEAATMAAGEAVGAAVGAGYRAVKGMRQAAKPVTNAVESATSGAAKKLSTNIPTEGRKFNQLSRRGWSQSSVDDLVNNPYTTRESINKATGNEATAYFKKMDIMLLEMM
jgi:hypothetical protein